MNVKDKNVINEKIKKRKCFLLDNLKKYMHVFVCVCVCVCVFMYIFEKSSMFLV